MKIWIERVSFYITKHNDINQNNHFPSHIDWLKDLRVNTNTPSVDSFLFHCLEELSYDI